MQFTHVESTDHFQIRVEIHADGPANVAPIEGAQFVQALKPGGRLDFGKLLSRRDKVRPAGVDHVAIDLDDAGAASLTAALAAGPANVDIVYLWEDGSHLGTWHLHAARVAPAREGLIEADDGQTRVALDVDAVTFEEA